MGASFLSRATMPGSILPTTYGSGLGVFPSATSQNAGMSAIQIATLGDAFVWGVAGNFAANGIGCASSTTRGVTAGGGMQGPPYTSYNFIGYMTLASQSNLQNFGTLTTTRSTSGSISNQTRGVFPGGAPSRQDIDYITIATTGNATVFGSVGTTWDYLNGGCQSPTRGCWGGGFRASSSSARIDYIEFASTGNAINFGNLTVARYLPNGTSSSTRGIWQGGGYSVSTMDYITIASTGNATSFGSSIYQKDASGSGVSNNTRAVWAGNSQGFDEGRTLEYVTIATTGNSLSFGAAMANMCNAAMSNNHGGLQ